MQYYLKTDVWPENENIVQIQIPSSEHHLKSHGKTDKKTNFSDCKKDVVYNRLDSVLQTFEKVCSISDSYPKNSGLNVIWNFKI